TAGEPFRLAIFDAMMPEMDGLTLTARVRESAALAALPIIMLSSAGQQSDASRCRELGVVYLTKPVKQSELLRTITTVLSTPAGHPSETELERGSPQPPAASAPTSSLRVLVAEDNPVNQALAVRMLEKLGHHGEVVGNGRQALEAIAAGGY